MTIIFSELRRFLNTIAQNQLVFVDRKNLSNPSLDKNSMDVIKGEMKETKKEKQG